MSKDLIGKEVSILVEVTESVSVPGTLLALDEKGALIERSFRGGTRIDFIPLARILSVVRDLEIGPRRKAIKKFGPSGTNALLEKAEKMEASPQEEEEDEFDDESTDLSPLEEDDGF